MFLQAQPMQASSSLMSEVDAPAINRIGRFHILRELGRGIVGAVYLAHDPVIDRKVAVKTFNPGLHPIERKQHAEEFINEARAAGRISHPGIKCIVVVTI